MAEIIRRVLTLREAEEQEEIDIIPVEAAGEVIRGITMETLEGIRTRCQCPTMLFSRSIRSEVRARTEAIMETITRAGVITTREASAEEAVEAVTKETISVTRTKVEVMAMLRSP